MTDDLNRQIALALGYTDLEMRTYWVDDPWSTDKVEFLHGVKPGARSGDYLPDWAHDLNAALALADTIRYPYYLTVTIHGGGNHDVRVWRHIQKDESDIVDERITKPLAAAICECWLAWKAGQGE